MFLIKFGNQHAFGNFKFYIMPRENITVFAFLLKSISFFPLSIQILGNTLHTFDSNSKSIKFPKMISKCQYSKEMAVFNIQGMNLTSFCGELKNIMKRVLQVGRDLHLMEHVDQELNWSIFTKIACCWCQSAESHLKLIIGEAC